MADDPRAGRAVYRGYLRKAAKDYVDSTLQRDRRAVRNATQADLASGGVAPGPQLDAKIETVEELLRDIEEAQAAGKSTTGRWRMLLDAASLLAGTLGAVTKIGHAIKELIELAKLVRQT